MNERTKDFLSKAGIAMGVLAGVASVIMLVGEYASQTLTAITAVVALIGVVLYFALKR